MRVVVVGYGPVGARFVDELLPAVRAGLVDLTVIGAEAVNPYNRVLVAEYALRQVDWDAIELTDAEEARAAGVCVMTGIRVIAVDRTARTVRLHDGGTVEYDRLVLATGARANVPTLLGVPRDGPARGPGLDHELPFGVRVLRDRADADAIAAIVRPGARVVVLGAGVLGLEFALLVARSGMRVAVVHHGPVPMPRSLDRGAGVVLSGALRAAGVEIIAHSRAESVEFRHDGADARFDALTTADGKTIPGDLLVLSCGAGARTELASASGLHTSTGVVVTRELASVDDVAVFAIGDCAQVLDAAPSGLIGPGWRQAERLAARFASDVGLGARPADPPTERAAVVMLKGGTVDAVAAGDVSAEPWDMAAGRAVAQWADPEHGRYVKMITRDGVLEAFACVGMPRTGAELTVLFERGGELPSDRSLLLRFDGPDDELASAADAYAPDATVCLCNGVSVGQIESAVHDGSDTVEGVGKATRAGTGCGGCRSRITDLIQRFTPAAEPV